MPKLTPVDELERWIRQDVPPSDWLEVTQERVDKFADATNDFQFIHVDVEAASKTPFGGTIAHGFLTLSLVTHLIESEVIVPQGAAMGLNYGSDKIRYLNPVRVGKRIRAHQVLRSVTRKDAQRILLRNRITIEIENEETPAMIADFLALYILGKPE